MTDILTICFIEILKVCIHADIFLWYNESESLTEEIQKMNQWYFDIGILLVMLLLIVGIIICVISFITKLIRKINKKTVIIAAGIHFVLLIVTSLYAFSHSTYYKYNDWIILQSNIHMIEEKYGEFDLGEIKDGEKA